MREEQETIRDELASLSENTRAMAQVQVAMQRDLNVLDDRVRILTFASASDEDRPHA